jgi:hypothetical protein
MFCFPNLRDHIEAVTELIGDRKQSKKKLHAHQTFLKQVFLLSSLYKWLSFPENNPLNHNFLYFILLFVNIILKDTEFHNPVRCMHEKLIERCQNEASGLILGSFISRLLWGLGDLTTSGSRSLAVRC